MLLLLLSLPLGAVLQPWLWPQRSQQPAVPRGVLAPLLLVTVPGLSTAHVGHLSGDDGATPNLDRLAREGVSFTRFWAASNNPVASAAALLTGRAVSQTGVTGLGHVPPPGTITLTRQLQRRGHPGVALLADARVAGPTLARHFGQVISSGQDGRPELDTEALLALAVEALLAQPDAFVWVDLPATGLLQEGPARPAAASALDAALGRALAALESAQRLETLMLCVTGTSGEPFPADNLFEPALAVPCLLRLPGQAFRGRRLHLAAGSVDLTPTLAELVLKRQGSSSWEGLCGTSLMSKLSGGVGRRRVRVAEGLHRADASGEPVLSRAVRMADTKLIAPAGAAGQASLYDLSADPDERQDRGPERPLVVDAMRRHLQTWMAACGSP
ncbi:MAG: hypothetical protein DRQ55_02965 [Planctomycetota bacterium]|nr:MAG: hypothetical protein DRQ55_02965 [Planctomycetota bacterium]